MKPALTFFFAASILCISAHAEPFGGQPAIAGALKKLKAAHGNVAKAQAGDKPEKHLEEASKHLAAAKLALENANKNKGSARPAAIRTIDQAAAEVEAGKTDSKRLTKASELITEALEDTIRAGKAGRG